MLLKIAIKVQKIYEFLFAPAGSNQSKAHCRTLFKLGMSNDWKFSNIFLYCGRLECFAYVEKKITNISPGQDAAAVGATLYVPKKP